jgi:outer membrane receptor for ferrienterochelin and colicins
MVQSSRKPPLAVLAAAVAAFLIPALADAQGSASDLQLLAEEGFMIQAATKTELPVSKAPSSVTVITTKQIRESGVRTIPELLRLVAGVNVRWNPMVQNFDIRGFGQTPFTSRVLLLIDGIPYNSWDKGGFPQHPGFDFFMLQNVKRLEIVRGPGSALYGENAFWGVINIVTLSGDDLQGGRVELYGGDLENQALSALYGQKLGDDASIFVSARAQRGQLPVEFWFEEADSVAEGTDFFVKTKLKNWELSYYRHEDSVEGYSENVGPGTFTSAEEIGQTVNILAVKSHHEVRPDVVLAGNLSYANRYGSHCAACHSLPLDPEEFEGQSDHGSQLLGDVSLNLRNIPGHDILVGVEGRKIKPGDHTEELLSPHEDHEVEVEYTKLAAYLQDQISLAEDRVRLTLGVRYDGKTDTLDDKVSPRAALVYAPNDRLALRAGWSTAFRFPNSSEKYSDTWFINALTPSGAAFPFAVFGANPDLQPEEIRTFDFGAEYKLSEEWSAKLDLYRSKVKDFIVISIVPGPVPAIVSQNHPDTATLDGFEFELRYRAAKGFTGFVSYAYQDPSQDGNLLNPAGQGIEFVYAPESKINFGAYWGPFRGFSGSIEGQWRDETQGPSFYNTVTGGDGRLESFTRLGARLSWDLPLKIADGLRLSLYGKNLLDEEIVETYVPINMTQPGRTFYGAIELKY